MCTIAPVYIKRRCESSHAPLAAYGVAKDRGICRQAYYASRKRHAFANPSYGLGACRRSARQIRNGKSACIWDQRFSRPMLGQKRQKRTAKKDSSKWHIYPGPAGQNPVGEGGDRRGCCPNSQSSVSKRCKNADLVWFNTTTHSIQHEKAHAVNQQLLNFLDPKTMPPA